MQRQAAETRGGRGELKLEGEEEEEEDDDST